MFEDFIINYGYYAVFLFACIEGEVALLTAGFLCTRGLLSIKMVILVAFLGTMLFEQCMFFVGRVYGYRLLNNKPALRAKIQKVMDFLHKYDTAFIFSFRFVYGIRNISPIIIGAARIPPLKFSLLNIPAALIWSVTVGGAGYLFANVLDAVMLKVEYLQYVALLVLLIAFACFRYRRQIHTAWKHVLSKK